MKRGIPVLALFLIIALPSISAEILMGQVGNIYNIGDELSLDLTLQPTSTINDFLTVSLLCGENSAEIYRNSFDLGFDDKEEVSINVLLTNSVVSELRGNCLLFANYGDDLAESSSFELTDKINIDFNVENPTIIPGGNVVIFGNALKLNGEAVEGFIEVRIPDIEIELSKRVSDGKFLFNFSIPFDSKSGQHILAVRVYEKGTDEITNQGEVTETIEIAQILRLLDITLNSQSVFPGDEVVYKVIPFDQAGDVVVTDVGIVILEPGDFIYEKKLLSTTEEGVISISVNTTPGYWKIEASTEDLNARKLFYVEENEEAFFSLINNTLLVTNVGNVPYEKNVEVSIGSIVELMKIELDVSETRKFKLKAPDGSYSIKAYDGKTETPLGNTFLTGRAVSIGEVREGFLGAVNSPVILILVIILAALAFFYIIYKKKMKKSIKKTGIEGTVVGSIISNGIREEASSVALNLKSELTALSTNSLDRALIAAKESGARVYIDGNFRIILFSSSLTKRQDNEVLAVKKAKKIEEIFKEHNLKWKDKIDYGIGVNNGEIISETRTGKFRFTSVGNIIGLAKRISAAANKEVLISESVHRKTAGVIRTEQVQGRNFWSVSKISGLGQNIDKDNIIGKLKEK